MKLTDITEHSDFIHNLPLMTMSQRWGLHRARVNFGKQLVELWMFVPVGEDGSVLEEPIETIGGVEMYAKEYEKAKERCLFSINCDFVYNESSVFHIIDFLQEDVDRILIYKDKEKAYHTIESLSYHPCLELTPTALKHLNS